MKESGVYVAGKYLAGFYAVNKDVSWPIGSVRLARRSSSAPLKAPVDRLLACGAGSVDPVADEWERRALCLSLGSPLSVAYGPRMGIDADPRATPKLECKEDTLLKFNGWAAQMDVHP